MRVDAGIGHGREELYPIVGRWLGAFDEWREEIEEMRDLGSQVCVVSTQHGRGRGTGGRGHHGDSRRLVALSDSRQTGAADRDNLKP